MSESVLETLVAAVEVVCHRCIAWLEHRLSQRTLPRLYPLNLDPQNKLAGALEHFPERDVTDAKLCSRRKANPTVVVVTQAGGRK